MPETSRPHDVTGLTAGELDRARRELQASLARPESPARGPILAHLNAINAELTERAGQCPTTGPLADLRWHWGGVYLISGIIGCWRAERRDDGRTLTADDPEKLRRAMIADYTAKPVSRGPLPRP